MSAFHPIRPCAEFPNDNEELHAGSRWILAASSGVVTAHLPDAQSVCFEAAPLTPIQKQESVVCVADAPDLEIAVLEEHALETTIIDDIEPASLPAVDVEDPFLAELAPFTELASFAESGERPRWDAGFVDETPTQKLRPMIHTVQTLVPLHFELTPLPPQVSEWSQLTTLLTDHLLQLGHTRASALIGPLLNAELVDLSRLDSAVIEQLQRDGVACPRGARVVSSPSFRSSAHVFREELGNGGLDANEALFWLTQLVGALIGDADDHEALESTLRGLGIARLLERAA